MYLSHKHAWIIWVFALAVGLMTARAAVTTTWQTTTGDWSVVANWSGGVPDTGYDVVITNAGAYVHLTNSTFYLSSLIISNATLSFSNWDTTLYVTNLTIRNSGKITCWGPFTNNGVSNRVNFTCSNLVIETGGSINIQGKGFSGGTNTTYAGGQGPGAGTFQNAAAGYGGSGSRPIVSDTYFGYGGAMVYGSATAPTDPGSGGAAGWTASDNRGGCGGGAVCITAVQVVVNGNINADASPPTSTANAAGGSGGGIYITCSTITGTNGTITANGSGGSLNNGHGGGGGRIAVIYNSSAQSNLPMPSLRFSAAPGLAGQYWVAALTSGDIGTLYFPDNYFFSPTNLFTGQWLAPGLTNLSVADLLVSNVWIRLPGAGFRLTVTNTLTVVGTNSWLHRLELTNDATVNCGQIRLNNGSLGVGSTLNCAGDLTLTNIGRLFIYSALSNGAGTGYGALVSVSSNILVPTNCWIYPAAHPTNGAVPLFRMRNLTIDSGGGFNANYLGCAGSGNAGNGTARIPIAYGPGKPVSVSCGAGYGGKGGEGPSYGDNGGPVYGSSNAPVDPGSGSWSGYTGATIYYGCFGGGSVQIRATDTVALQGTLTANGSGETRGGTWNGGGSGGGIYITCRTFIGNSNGVIQANGGTMAVHGGGGGGGRIAVWRIFDRSTSTVSNYVNGGLSAGSGAGSNGYTGTIVYGNSPPAGTIFSVR